MLKTFILIAGLVVGLTAGSACTNGAYADNPVQTPPSEEKSAAERMADYSSKPTQISDADIASILVVKNSIKNSANDSESVISKWSGELRVSIQDGDGRDFDLTTPPGLEIKNYLTKLADIVHLPIQITTVAQQNNNVSIVLVNLGVNGDHVFEEKRRQNEIINLDGVKAGEIMGVPELAVADRTFAAAVRVSYNNVWHGFSYTSPTDDAPQINHHKSNFTRTFRVGNTIRACFISLLIDGGYYIDNGYPYPKKSNDGIVADVEVRMPDCLGLGQSVASVASVDVNSLWRRLGKGYIPDWESLSWRNLYLLRQLYNKDIVIGMTAAAAQDIITKNIRNER